MGGLLGYSTNWKIPDYIFVSIIPCASYLDFYLTIRSRNRNRVVIFPIEKMTWIPTHCFHYPDPKFAMATILGSFAPFDSYICNSRKIQLASLYVLERLFPIMFLDRQHHHCILGVLQIRSAL